MVRAAFGGFKVCNKVACLRIKVTAFAKVKETLRMNTQHKTQHIKHHMKMVGLLGDEL